MAGQLALPDLLRQRFGTDAFSRVDPETATVGTTVVRILRQNPNRLGFIIINLHATNVLYVVHLGVPSATRGFRIGPGGGSLRCVWDEDFDMCGYEWRGIADAAGTTITTTEIVTA